MVRLSGWLRAARWAGAITAVFAIAAGVALTARGRTPVEVVGALLLPTLGLAVLVAVVAGWTPPPVPSPRTVELDGEAAEFYPRASGWRWVAAQATIALPGLWSAAMAITGTLEGQRGWALFAVPAVFFLGGPVGALWGRTNPGGVWLSPSRVVDEHLGLHRTVALADIGAVSALGGRVSLTLVPGATATADRDPWPWARRPDSGVPVIDVATIAPGFVDRLRAALAADRGGTDARPAPVGAAGTVDPARLPVRRPERRGGPLAADLVLAAVALGAAWLLEVPSAAALPPPAVHLLAGYGIFVAVVLVAHAIALATASGFPRLAPLARDGVDGVGVRAWVGDHWRDLGIDAGLAVLGIGLLAIDLATGGAWLPWSALAAFVGAWFGVGAGLRLGGRRLPEAIWVGGGDLVHEGADGTRRAPLASVLAVVVSVDHTRLLIRLAAPASRRLCPRPWRGHHPDPQRIVIETGRFGHSPSDIAQWLRSAAGE